MFSCMIAKATILEEVSSGIASSRNGALLLVSS
jgi:homeobox-leucine zipper protein